jgi:nucleoside-diphosphate-sugar epimerase/SAM-dependent methyltransferase
MGKQIALLLVISVILYATITIDIRKVLHNVSIENLKISIKCLSLDPRFSSSQLHIAVIGSSGYIGSRLVHYLQTEKNWSIVEFDRHVPGSASYEITAKDLHTFQVVIYLGGLTSHEACQKHPNDVERENVDDIYKLVKRMLPTQLLIFASTAAIAESSGPISVDEEFPVQPHSPDLYVNSLIRRENTLRNWSFVSAAVAPQIIGLRFGLVIGLSSSQRIDIAHMSLICQAFLGGRLHISNPDTFHAFLCMEDLLRAITILIKQSKNVKRFDIFHLQSFSASMSGVANTIACRSGAHVKLSNHSLEQNTSVYFLNSTKFSSTFNFTFKGTQDQIVTRLVEDVPRMCLGRQSPSDDDSIPCVVCGSHDMLPVLNLHKQPLANDFKTQMNDSQNCSRFPLRLVRCRKCHHVQLSYIVEQEHFLSLHEYQEETNETLNIDYKWFAEKVIDESGKINGTVLEVACRSGSQLNHFLNRGWKTIGVDMSNNFTNRARTRGHTVYTGFWGTDKFPNLPSPESLNAIIAHNVLSYVHNPLQFLRACATVMSTTTKLYIRIPECEMLETGQFDDVCHQHVSYFTAHSFTKIASMIGLYIVHFQTIKTRRHSCLITLQRTDTINTSFNTTAQKHIALSFSSALQKERDLGMTEAWFYVKYQAQAQALRQWIGRQLTFLFKQRHEIVAYDAETKHIVLLHFLLEMPERSWKISYVIDDTPSKQNTYCPGTAIPVRRSSELSKYNSSMPLTILIFAWDTWENVSKNIRDLTVKKGMKNVFLILPFPHQQLIKLEVNEALTLTQNTYKLLSWPNILPFARRPVLLVTHFFNEELLLPLWIRHHSSMFDMAILIDYNSTDRSCEIIRNEAPSTWKVVPSRNKYFMSIDIDLEVMDYEKMYPTAWKIALNIPEFLVHHNLREMLAEMEPSNDIRVLRFRSVIMVGNDSTPFQRNTSLLKQRSQYMQNPSALEQRSGITMFSRYMHRHPYGIYKPGRHDITVNSWQWAPIGFIAKYQYTPWPEIINRKLQIRTRVLQSEFNRGWATYHNVDLKSLTNQKHSVNTLPHADLKDFIAPSGILAMAHRLWRETTEDEG